MSRDARLRLIVVGVSAVFIVVLVALSLNRRTSPVDISNVTVRSDAVQLADKDIPGLLQYNVPSNDHTDQVVHYPQLRPVGGAHYPVWQNCGVYTDFLHDEF